MTDDPKKKIVRIMKEAAPKRRAPRKPSPPPAVSNVFNISGSGNITAGGDVHVHQPAPALRPPVQPGVEHITPEQRKILKKLVDDISETEARLKKNPKVYASVYSVLFRQFPDVKKLEQIPLTGFEAARSYLHQWLGRLNAMPSAPVKNVDDWRKRRYTYIKVNTKVPEDADALAAYIKRNFSAESLTELSNDELEKAYRYVAGRRNKRR